MHKLSKEKGIEKKNQSFYLRTSTLKEIELLKNIPEFIHAIF